MGYVARLLFPIIGYKRTMLIGYAALPIRCFAIVIMREAGVNNDLLIITQVLDAVGVGIFALSVPAVVRALTEGTGRFAFTLALVHTLKAVGQALSMLFGGILAEQEVDGLQDYTLAFLVLGATALVPLFVLACGFQNPSMHGEKTQSNPKDSAGEEGRKDDEPVSI